MLFYHKPNSKDLKKILINFDNTLWGQLLRLRRPSWVVIKLPGPKTSAQKLSDKLTNRHETALTLVTYKYF